MGDEQLAASILAKLLDEDGVTYMDVDRSDDGRGSSVKIRSGYVDIDEREADYLDSLQQRRTTWV